VAGEVTFQMTEADYVAANRDWFLRTILKRKAIIRHAVALGVAFTAGVVLAGGDRDTFTMGQLWYGLGLAGAAAGGLLLLYVVTYALIPRRAGRLFRQQTGFHRPLTFSWSDDGMAQTSAHGTGTYAWRDLHRWTAGRDSIMPYVTDQLYFVIPRRVLSDAQANDLVATLEQSGLSQY
jgi:hypothetical protein